MADQTPKDRTSGAVVATSDDTPRADAMTCEACQNQLLAYHYGELDDAARAAVEAELSTCDACERAYRALALTADAYADVPVPEPRGVVRQNVLREARLKAADRAAGGARSVWAPLLAWATPAVILIGGAWLAVGIATGGDEAPQSDMAATVAQNEELAPPALERGDEEELARGLMEDDAPEPATTGDPELADNEMADDDGAAAPRQEVAPPRGTGGRGTAEGLARGSSSAPGDVATRGAVRQQVQAEQGVRGREPAAAPAQAPNAPPEPEPEAAVLGALTDEGFEEADSIASGRSANGFGAGSLGSSGGAGDRDAPASASASTGGMAADDSAVGGLAPTEARERTTRAEARSYANLPGEQQALGGAEAQDEATRSVVVEEAEVAAPSRRSDRRRAEAEPAAPAAAAPAPPPGEPEEAPASADAERAPSPLAAARAAYDQRAWSEVAAALSSWLNGGGGTPEERQEGLYLLGASYVRLGDNTAARTTLQRLVDTWPSGRWSSDARTLLQGLEERTAPALDRLEADSP